MEQRNHRSVLLAAVFCLGFLGCSTDNRVAKDAAVTVLSTTIRDQAVLSAEVVAKACLDLEWSLQLVGAQNVPGAQSAWIRARLAYDHGSALFKLAAPELDALIDGELDTPLTRVGLRKLEQPLFGKPTADGLTLNQGAQGLAAAAVRLPSAMADTSRALDIGAFWGTLSGLAVVSGTKLDGSDSPFAGQSLASARALLEGIAASYEPLSGLLQPIDAALDTQIHQLLSDLLGQLRGVSSTDQLADKALFLRRSADLGQALLRVAKALGSQTSAVVDVT